VVAKNTLQKSCRLLKLFLKNEKNKKKIVINNKGNNKTKVKRVLLIPIFQAKRYKNKKKNAGLITIILQKANLMHYINYKTYIF